MLYSSNNLHYFIASSSFLLSFASFAFNIPRLQQSLTPSDGLSDEHVLIAAYVSQLQSSTRLVLGKQIVCGRGMGYAGWLFFSLSELGWMPCIGSWVGPAHPLTKTSVRKVCGYSLLFYLCLLENGLLIFFFLKGRSLTKCYEEKKRQSKNERFMDALALKEILFYNNLVEIWNKYQNEC